MRSSSRLLQRVTTAAARGVKNPIRDVRVLKIVGCPLSKGEVEKCVCVARKLRVCLEKFEEFDSPGNLAVGVCVKS